MNLLTATPVTSVCKPVPSLALGQDIVIVEDDPKLADMLANYLQAHGFTPHVVADGALAVAAVQRIAPVAVLLDVVLPNVNGIEICAALRRHSAAPIIMISARVEEIDRVLGLEVGADDYVCKPFSPREVLARVHAQLRRAQGRLVPSGVSGAEGAAMDASAALEAIGFVVDDEQQRIRWQGQPLPLTPLEYRLLRLLLSRPGQVFSRDRLLDVAHRDHGDAEISDRAIDSHIKNLRRKLHAAGTPRAMVASVYGAGYRFESPSSTATSASS
jgi:two-component system, OmpR family, response regulator BaeR